MNSLWKHARQLADKLGVKVWVCDTCDDVASPHGEAVVDDGEGFIHITHRPNTRVAYLVTLHELGHLASVRRKNGRFRMFRSRARLTEETEAWRWALEHTQFELGPEEWAEIHWRLKTYGDDRRFRRDPDFDRLLAEAERKAA